MKSSAINAVFGAALQGSLRVRAQAVDLDHLYLGVIAVGGAAARRLGRHGISLTSARQAVRDTQTSDLVSLGIDVAAPEPLADHAVPNVPWETTARAGSVVREIAKAASTTGALKVLLGEPSGIVRRLVEADGVDPEAMIAELRTAPADPQVVHNVPLDSSLLPGPGRAQQLTHFVSAPPSEVVDALTDLAVLIRTSYDEHQSSALPGNESVELRRRSKTMTVRHDISQCTDGDTEVVTWRYTMTSGERDGEPLRYERFEVRCAPGGTEVTHTSGRRTFGMLGRLMAPLTSPFVAGGLRHNTYRLSAAVSERQNR